MAGDLQERGGPGLSECSTRGTVDAGAAVDGGFARNRRARNFYLGLTAITATVAALTDWT